MRSSSTIPFLLIIVTVLLVSGNIGAEMAGTPQLSVEALERQLEMGRHEQLTALKKNPQSRLADFTSDGCSGGLSVGWEYLAGKIKNFHARFGTRPAWESCCITHDRAYHAGGERYISAGDSFSARREADLALKECVVKTGNKKKRELAAEYNLSAEEVETLYTAISALMFRAVRIGGMPCTGLPWRWGYGWPECE